MASKEEWKGGISNFLSPHFMLLSVWFSLECEKMAPVSQSSVTDENTINSTTDSALHSFLEMYNTNSTDIMEIRNTSERTFIENEIYESNVEGQVNSAMTRLHEFQIIKVVVLACVTLIILLSICKMVLQLFVRYTVKQDKC